MNTKSTNEFNNFIDAFVDELIATPDEEILEGIDPATAHAKGVDILQAAKFKAGRLRLAAAKAGYAALKSKPVIKAQNVSAEEARRFLAQSANDTRFTLAARNLSELSDSEAIALYIKLKSLAASTDGEIQ